MCQSWQGITIFIFFWDKFGGGGISSVYSINFANSLKNFCQIFIAKIGGKKPNQCMTYCVVLMVSLNFKFKGFFLGVNSHYFEIFFINI